MALVQDSTGYYLEPSTGQYYSPMPVVPRSSYGYGMNMYGGPIANAYWSGMGGMLSQATGRPIVANSMVFNGKPYIPFKGDAQGISQGKRSVVDAMIGNRQPYQYNAPSLAEMFPSLQGQMQSQMPMQGDAGAGRFMGGLLGAMPTPVSSTTTQAPSSSGAGRFL